MRSDWTLEAAPSDRSLVVFGDLNCPFCYALEERLNRRELTGNVEWRLVEHAPELPTALGAATSEERAELAAELTALVERAPDVQLNRPPFRPRSGPAIRALAAARSLDPAAADRLRLALYRALWLDGRNIADPKIILAYAEDCGFGALDGDAHAATADEWTAQWRASEANRIPCMVSASGAQLLGLSTVERLDLFLRSGLFGSRTDDSCGPA